MPIKSELSPREKEVLELAVKGYTDDAIAGQLGIECGTVNSYWVRIRGKLGNYSRTELGARWVQAGADLASKEEADRRDAVADELAAANKNLLDKANLEIERLKGLLSKNGDR